MRNCNFNMLTVKCFLMFFLMWDHVGFAAAVAGDGGKDASAGPSHFSVPIGAVLDYNSSMGAMADFSISMALRDFYVVHSGYRTRLALHKKYARRELDVAAAVFELMKNEEVHSILDSIKLTEDKFVEELAGKAHVPVISFNNGCRYLSSRTTPYHIQTTPDISNQAKALAALCREFEWHEVVVLYEDSDYGTHFLSRIHNEFQTDDIQVVHGIPISASAADHHIQKELRKLMTRQTRAFLVHMNAQLGSKLFHLAKHTGLMSEGYAWITTDGIGNFMNSMGSDAVDSMEGVLGLRPYIPPSRNLDNLKTRWKKNMLLTEPESSLTELNVYGLRAYDTVWALAMAIEKIGPVKLGFLEANNSKSGSDVFNLGISQLGPKLLKELQDMTFEGLAGEFHLIDAQLKPSPLEIFNVYATGDRIVGYWTPDGGITRRLGSTGGQKYSTSTKELKSIVWPGDSVKQPKGWPFPPTVRLKVGIPKKEGFIEFVNSSTDPQTNKTEASGYSIDIFLSALQQLPFLVHYDFVPFTDASGLSNGTYNELLHNISCKTFDMVVGDVTILADRTNYVDFTLPYSESGTLTVVKAKKDKNMWVFKKPFRWDLWITTVCTCIFIGIVLRILENGVKKESDSLRPHKQRLGLLFLFPIAVLAFPERNMVVNNWSRFVLVVWLFMAFILMQSYTANLSVMFTVDQFEFSFSDDYIIGCQTDSFVKDFLIKSFNIKESRIKEYSTIDEYHEAMSKGSKNGGIDAIFDEIPYMKLFLGNYDSQYKIVGSTYRTDGFAFRSVDDMEYCNDVDAGIPKRFFTGSPLLKGNPCSHRSYKPDSNRAEKLWPYVPYGYQIDSINSDSPSLTAYNFGGLFIIIGSALIFALLCSETPVGRRVVEVATSYSHKCFAFLSFRRNGESRVQSMAQPDRRGDSSSEEEEARGSYWFNADDLSRPGLAHESRDDHADEIVESNSTCEVQLAEQTNTSL